MNYLAHLYFSEARPMAWAGTLMGDFVKGKNFDGLPSDLVAHLKLHRHLDSYTRISPAFQTSRRRIDPVFSHGRSVMVDVFYDHLLACHWDDYSPIPLPRFSQQVYAGLHTCRDLLHVQLLSILPRMTADNWLLSYRQREIVGRVLWRIEQRLNHKLPLARGESELDRLAEPLLLDFRAFMIEVAARVEDWKDSNGGTC